MARFVCLLLLSAFSGILAQNPALWRSVRSADNGTAIGQGRLLGGTDVAAATTYPYIVFIYMPPAVAGDPVTDYAPAVVIKSNYVITHSSHFSLVTDVKTLRVGAGILTADLSSPTGLITRRVKSRFSYPLDTTVSPAAMAFETIALYKVCPSFPTSDIAVAPAAMAATGDPLILINYTPTLQETAAKKVGENCECDEYAVDQTEYDAEYVPNTFCGAEDAAIKIETTDKSGTIAIVNGVYAGFSSMIDKGELFIDIMSADYTAWITSTAV